MKLSIVLFALLALSAASATALDEHPRGRGRSLLKGGKGGGGSKGGGSKGGGIKKGVFIGAGVGAVGGAAAAGEQSAQAPLTMECVLRLHSPTSVVQD